MALPAQVQQAIQTATPEVALGADNASVDMTYKVNVTQAQLTMQMAQLQNQVANWTNAIANANAQISTIQGQLALIPVQVTPPA